MKIFNLSELLQKKRDLRYWLKLAIYLIIGFFFGFLLILIIIIGNLRSLLTHYPTLSGFPLGERNYLVLFQNNNELRPTGGFISAYGILKFKNGFIESIDIHDSYNEINQFRAAAPYPLELLLAGPTYPGHGFRDANFDPDFPSSARELESFFMKAYQNIPLNGIISIDLSVIEDLLKLTGSIKIDGITFNSENLFINLEEAVSNIDLHNLDQIKNRKNILKKFAKKLLAKLPYNLTSFSQIKDLLLKELDQKHILLYFKDETLQNIVRNFNWDGSLAKKEGDFLSLVEANLGGMKSDRYIQRELNYELDITEDTHPDASRKARASLTIKMNHFGTQNIPFSGWYQGWIRAFIPKGSTIISKKISDEEGKEINLISDDKPISLSYTEEKNDLLGLGTRIVFTPNQTRQIKITYELPAGVIKNDRYSLYLRKQPGTESDYYQVIIKVPQGRRLKSRDFLIKEDRAFYQGFLTKDKLLTLNILGDKYGPRVNDQEIPELNLIKIYFNEPIDSKWNYFFKITDLNLKNKEITDEIKLLNYEFPDERVLILNTSGMTNQGEEHFAIIIDGIRDRYGNKIAPNPRSITAVYRGKK